MKALRRKDRPWTVPLAVAGVVAIVAGIGDGGFFQDLVAGSGCNENVFVAAWIGGLVLGFVPVAFDEVLGMADGLRQRDVTPEHLFAARLVGIAEVLFAWLVLWLPVSVPVMAVFEQATWPDGGAVAQLAASAFAAVPAAAIGLFAAYLPLSWPLRLVVCGGVFLAVFSGIDEVACGGDELVDAGLFLGLQALAAIVFTALAFASCRERVDRDRPLRPRVRVAGVTAAVLGLVAIGHGCLLECETSAQAVLRETYPEIWTCDGHRVLAVRGRSERLVVDGEHRPTGAIARTPQYDFGWPAGPRTWLGFDQPQWGRRTQWVWSHGLLVAADGRVWRQGQALHRLEPTGIGPACAPLAPGTRVWWGDDGVVALAPAGGLAHRFVAENGWFEPIVLPASDRLVEVAESTRDGAAATHLLLRGEAGVYILEGGAIVAAPSGIWPRSSAPSRHRDRVDAIGDRIEYTVDLPAEAEHPAFHHEFRPRTAREHALAWLARLIAAGGAPVFQIGWRSPGALAAAFALALLAAFAAVRRLRRLGASPGAQGYWFLVTTLLGPLGWACAFVFERPRAWAVRPVVTAVAPRIFTQWNATENP